MGVPARRPVRLRRQRHHRRQQPVRRPCQHGERCRRSASRPTAAPRDDLIIGSQAGDHLAGGSGDDTILGLRGVDHIYGDSGFNVDILTRGLTVTSVNSSPRPTLDKRNPAGDQTIKPVPSVNADLLDAGRDRSTARARTHDRTTRRPHAASIGRTVHAITTTRTQDGVRRRHLRRPRHRVPADRRPERARQAAAEDPDHDDRARSALSSRAPTRTAPTTRSSATSVVTSSSAAPVTTWPTATRPTTWCSATTSSCCAASSRRVPDRDRATAARPTRRAARFQTLCGDADVQPHRPARTRAVGDRHCRQQRTAARRQHLAATYRDPDSPGGIDTVPVVGRVSRRLRQEHQRRRRVPQLRRAAQRQRPRQPERKGRRAASATTTSPAAQNHDLVFGQMGNDVIQGDGGIEDAQPRTSHVGGSRTPDGCPATDLPGDNFTHGGTCDYVGDLDLSPPSRRRPTARTTSRAMAATTSCSAARARTTSSAAAPTSSA